MGVSLTYGKNSWDGSNSGGTLQGKTVIISSKSYGETYFFVYNGEYGSPNCSVAFVSKHPNGAGSYSFWNFGGTAGLMSPNAGGDATKYGYITYLNFSSWESGSASTNKLGTGWSVLPKAYILKNGWNLHDVGAIVYGHPEEATTVDVIEPFTTKWKLYIDGTKLPNYKLLWDNNKASENAVIHVFGAKEKVLDKLSPDLPANDEIQFLLHDVCKLTYKDFNSLCGNPSYDEGIGALLPKNGGWLGMYMTDGSKKSKQIAVNLYPKEVTDEEIHGSVHPTHLYGAIWSEGDDGSTLAIIENDKTWDGEEDETADKDDNYENYKDEEEENLPDTANNSIGVLTSTYKMTRDRLSQLGNFLWSGNIFDSFSLVNSNPIENIISCKDIPFSIGGGTDKIIKLGNVDTGVNGEKVNTNFQEVTIGSITIPKKYNNFLDLAPYTKITIYLPYIGFKELDVTQIMGKTITVKYAVDVITGGCIAEIFCSNTRLYEFNGQIGIDIPITASNRAQVEAGYISNAVSGGADLLTGDVIGASESMLSSAFSKYHYSSTSAPSPSCVASLNRTCYIVIDRPTYDNLKIFNHTRGRMCNLSKKIGNLRGFTICDSHIDLSGIVATDAEKDEIIKILSSGFFA